MLLLLIAAREELDPLDFFEIVRLSNTVTCRFDSALPHLSRTPGTSNAKDLRLISWVPNQEVIQMFWSNEMQKLTFSFLPSISYRLVEVMNHDWNVSDGCHRSHQSFPKRPQSGINCSKLLRSLRDWRASNVSLRSIHRSCWMYTFLSRELLHAAQSCYRIGFLSEVPLKSAPHSLIGRYLSQVVERSITTTEAELPITCHRMRVAGYPIAYGQLHYSASLMT